MRHRAGAGAAALALGVSTTLALGGSVARTAGPTGPGPPQPATTTALPPDVPSFTPERYEVSPGIKDAPVRFVESVGSWSADHPADPAGRVEAAGYPAALETAAAPLLETGAPSATTAVRYPQYGGLTDTSASVMVLARQELRDGGLVTVRDVLLDVRLARPGGGDWTSIVDPPRPPLADPQPGGPTDRGRAVLTDPRLDLAGPGRADVTERRVGDGILAVLAELGRTWELEVQVLVSGHPGTVFPTTRLSNHAVGRPADVRAIDGRPVASIPRDDPVLTDVMASAGRAGATEVGGPLTPGGPGSSPTRSTRTTSTSASPRPSRRRRPGDRSPVDPGQLLPPARLTYTRFPRATNNSRSCSTATACIPRVTPRPGNR